jgi:hypothetical protein
MARLCHLRAILGETETCAEDRCAFWEDDGCMIERLGLQGTEPDVASFLLDLRDRLEGVTGESAAGLRSEFARRLGAE